VEHVQIHDTGNGRLHEEEGAVHSFFAEGAKYVYLWVVTNMLQGDTLIFAALITENYRVQKSLIVLYPMKYLHTEIFMKHLICIHKVLKTLYF
jgi:hypothetical protein